MSAIETLSCNVKGIIDVFDVTGSRAMVRHVENDVHPQNMALVIARALAGSSGGEIYSMCLGSGGTHLDAAGNLIFLPSNTLATSANLYEETYSAKINSNIVDSVSVPAGNSVIAKQSLPPEITAEITCTLFLPAGVPAGQAPDDVTTTDSNAPYIFDELGLKTIDGMLLTHAVFSPIEKTANRVFEIKYSLIISVN